jgi:hypothetical protein
MISRASALIVALCAFTFLPARVSAQAPIVVKSSAISEAPDKKNPPERSESASPPEVSHDLVIEMVVSLLKESDTFRDQVLRVQFQAQAADVLWNSAPNVSIEWFHRAWDAAEKLDREAERAAREARQSHTTSRGGLTFIPSALNLRAEVLRVAAKRDQKLGTELLERLEKAEREKADDASTTNNQQVRFFDPTEPAAVICNRLELAIELVKAGDVERAKTLADPALAYATTQGLIFLGTLRQKDAAAADERYAQLLSLTLKDPRTDATTVSLLSSYVFTPNLLVTATRRGRVSNQWSDATLPPPPAALRASFLKVAATVLLRPLPPPDQDRTSAGRAGTYFTIARLSRFFEQFAPEYLPALNARLAMLEPDTPEVYRSDDNGMLTAGLEQEDPAKDDLSRLLNLISVTPDVGERDTIYVKAIRVAAAKGDKRIREFADKIDNPYLRKRARTFADFVAARRALSDKDAEAVVRIVRTGELTPLQRVWALSEAASLLRRTDAARAIQLLDDAASLAYGMGNGDQERVQALACVASHSYQVDQARTWIMIDEVVKSSNAAPNVALDSGKLTAQLQAKGVSAVVQVDVPAFNLLNLFELLAKEDFPRINTAVRDLKGEGPRAATSLAVARSVLDRRQQH